MRETEIRYWLRHRTCIVTCARTILCVLAAHAGTNVMAHGGVFLEDDQCVVQIDFLRAHFTAYQPQTSANKEYCEDLPDVTATVFVLDYLHDSLREMPLDFRIIRDVNKLGRFAKWADIEKIENLDSHTVFYQPPVTRPNATFTAEHVFAEPGDYIGIVTTQHRSKDKIYRAVFPFEVGATGFGYWPAIVGLLFLVQVNYWVMSGGFSRWRATRNAAAPGSK